MDSAFLAGTKLNKSSENSISKKRHNFSKSFLGLPALYNWVLLLGNEFGIRFCVLDFEISRNNKTFEKLQLCKISNNNCESLILLCYVLKVNKHIQLFRYETTIIHVSDLSDNLKTTLPVYRSCFHYNPSCFIFDTDENSLIQCVFPFQMLIA